MESLVATSLFTFIVGVVLLQLDTSRRHQTAYLKEEELHQLVKMAVQTNQSHLTLNGQEVSLVQTDEVLRVYRKGELLVEIEEE